MVQVTSPEGKTYCIDTTEVTQSQYALFLAQAEKTALSLPESCSGVQIAPPPLPGPGDGVTVLARCGDLYNPQKWPDGPVVCVDWCQAYAYCQWAGKRLCGQIGGGPASTKTAADAPRDEWFNACSNQGKTTLPAGNDLPPGTCYDTAKVAELYPGYDELKDSDGKWLPDTTQQLGCHGQEGALSHVYDLVGSVPEWVNNCPDPSTCQTRGGGVMSSEESLSCAAFRTTFKEPASLVGIRCCADD